MSMVPEPTESPAAVAAVQTYERMAVMVGANLTNGFGGSFAVIPPEGEPQTLLLLDNNQSAAVFWSLLQTHAQIELQKIEEKGRGGAFGGFR